jgi:hypothetical protein
LIFLSQFKIFGSPFIFKSNQRNRQPNVDAFNAFKKPR